ncbi:hypothetical protein DFJ73DRAFT_779794 [Zopfochytrium polystomum]|nr:hypothetical protein DFJ73DRAFT_779794 [Zopfochytrium polystomum]
MCAADSYALERRSSARCISPIRVWRETDSSLPLDDRGLGFKGSIKTALAPSAPKIQSSYPPPSHHFDRRPRALRAPLAPSDTGRQRKTVRRSRGTLSTVTPAPSHPARHRQRPSSKRKRASSSRSPTTTRSTPSTTTFRFVPLKIDGFHPDKSRRPVVVASGGVGMYVAGGDQDIVSNSIDDSGLQSKLEAQDHRDADRAEQGPGVLSTSRKIMLRRACYISAVVMLFCTSAGRIFIYQAPTLMVLVLLSDSASVRELVAHYSHSASWPNS